jgi:hypothetical protein
MSRIALDTNLLLLYVVGLATGGPNGKRLKSYGTDDLILLSEFVSEYDRIVTTPNVWTEVSNIWPFGIVGHWRQDIPALMSDLIRTGIELAKPSRDVIDDPDFERLGLTDCVWLSVLDADTVLMTDDVPLYATALSRGLSATNFTHLRNFD